MTKPLPEWVIYKNQDRLGQALTWHKALDNLVKQANLLTFRVWRQNETQIVFVETDGRDQYKIQKERG